MIVITDTNIFYSALAAPHGEIAKILSERKNVQFLVPDYLLEEIEEHLPDIAKITKKTQKQIKTEFFSLQSSFIQEFFTFHSSLFTLKVLLLPLQFLQ